MIYLQPTQKTLGGFFVLGTKTWMVLILHPGGSHLVRRQAWKPALVGWELHPDKNKGCQMPSFPRGIQTSMLR
jgi:hypothetical protein